MVQMWSPPPIPVGAPGKHHLFLASEHLNPSSGVPGREMQGARATYSMAGKSGGTSGRVEPLGVCYAPSTFWFCRNKLQRQSQRVNEVTKYAAGRESVKGGGVMPVPLGTADTAKEEEDSGCEGPSRGFGQARGSGTRRE